MSGPVLLFWLMNVVFDTGGQLAFKAASRVRGDGWARWRALASEPWLWFGIACYLGEFVAWICFLSLVPLSEGVLLGSVNIIAIMIAGRLLFREVLSPLRVAGILLIALGVAVVGLG